MVQCPGDHSAIAVGLVVEPGVEARQPQADALLGRFVVAGWVAPIGRQHGVERERDQQAHQHRSHDREAKGAKPFARHPGHERHRDEHRHDGEGGGRHGQTDFGGALQGRFAAVEAAFHEAHDVLAHHDGIVDQHTNGQGQTQKAHEVERETIQPHRNEGGDDRGGQRQRGDQRGSPGVEEYIDHEDGQHRAKDQRFDHVVQAALGVLATVLGDVDVRAFGQGLVEAFDQAAHLVGHRHGGRFTRAGDGQAHIGVAVAHAEVVHLGKAVCNGGDLAQAHEFVAAAADHDLLEVGRRLDAPQQPDALVLHLATDLADWGGDVLVAQGVDHLGHRHVDLAQFLRMQQHAQFSPQRAIHLDLRHTRDGAELVGQLVFGQARNLGVFLRGR